MTAVRAASRALAAGLTTGIVLAVATLIWLAYSGVQGWRTSAAALAEERASENAQLLVRALTRDMRGAQASVLASPRWDEFMLDPQSDLGTLVASAFARYPYPESFFAWRADEPPVFFNRFDRRPPWIEVRPPEVPFPVTTSDDPAGEERSRHASRPTPHSAGRSPCSRSFCPACATRSSPACSIGIRFATISKRCLDSR